jgi:F0F1-type ATP synthase membrane subunit b/b'
MEEDFLDLGFVDQSLLNEFQDIKEEPADNQEENIEKNDEQPSNKEELSKEEIKDPEKKEVVENPDNKQETGSPNISSSIAEALVDEGVLQTLSKERLAEIKTTEDLIEAFKEDLGNQLTAEQKRVSDALTYGVEPTRIQQYEQWIKTLDNVTDELIEGEDEQNENYRKNLIYRDYLNKGFEESDAAEMVNRSVESGKDIDDAKKALSSLKKYYQKAYTDEVNEAKKEYDKHVASQKKQLEELKSSIIDDKENFYEQFELPKTSRQKVFDVVAKASVVDGDKKITPLQAFIKNDPNKANKIIGTLYVLTDGFTKFDGIMKGTVKKQVRQSVKNLEKALTTVDTGDGSLNLKSGIGENDDFKILDFAI